MKLTTYSHCSVNHIAVLAPHHGITSQLASSYVQQFNGVEGVDRSMEPMRVLLTVWQQPTAQCTSKQTQCPELITLPRNYGEPHDIST